MINTFNVSILDSKQSIHFLDIELDNFAAFPNFLTEENTKFILIGIYGILVKTITKKM